MSFLKASVYYLTLVALFVQMWLQRWSVPWSLLVVSLTTVWFAGRDCDPFRTWLYSHNISFWKLIMLITLL